MSEALTLADASVFCDVVIEKKVIKSFFSANAEVGQSNFEYFVEAGFTEDAFTSKFRQSVIKLMLRHFVEYGASPTLNVLQTKLKNQFKKQPTKYNELVMLLNKTLSVPYEASETTFIVSELRKYLLLRKITELNNKVYSELNKAQVSSEVDPEKILSDNIHEMTSALSYGDHQKRDGDIFKDVSIIDDLQAKRDNPEASQGLPTGMDVMDDLTNGWHSGELVLVSGRPGSGKSVFLISSALAAYEAGYNVLYFSLEMPYRQQQSRALANAYDTNYTNIKAPSKMTEPEWVEFKNRLVEGQTANKYFYVCEAPKNCTTSYIDSTINQLEGRFGVRFHLVVVDPLYLMKPMGVEKKDKDDAVGAVSMDLKLFAMRKHVPVLAATQFNREGGKRHQAGQEPNAMDLSFSDKLAYNSDMILGLHSDEDRLTEMHFLKFRDGRGPTLYLEKHFHKMKYMYSQEYNDLADINRYIEEGNRVL